jgi:hypothetical protein
MKTFDYRDAAKKAWKTRREKYGDTGVAKSKKSGSTINFSREILEQLDHLKGIGRNTEEKVEYIVKKYLDEKGLIG